MRISERKLNSLLLVECSITFAQVFSDLLGGQAIHLRMWKQIAHGYKLRLTDSSGKYL